MSGRLRETPRRLMLWGAATMAVIGAVLFVPLLWGSDLTMRNGRPVGFGIAMLSVVLESLVFSDDGVPQRVPPGARRGPARHRVSGSHWWDGYRTAWRDVLLVVVGVFGVVTVETGWHPWWALGLAVVSLLPIPVFLLRRVPGGATAPSDLRPGRASNAVRLGWGEIPHALHDAELDLDTVRTDESGLTVQGLLYRAGPTRWSRARRVPFALRVRQAVDVVVEDPDGIRVLVVADVLRDGPTVVVTSALNGSLRFTTDADEAEIETWS